LFSELITRKIPAVVLRLLLNVYLNQSTRVNWSSATSSSFDVLNGVKQGGILSPVLFCVYIDGLLNRLKSAKLGCYIGRTFSGALAYADDVTVLAPSAHAMRQMLHICTEYAAQYAITFNVKKTKCLIFDRVFTGRDIVHPKFYINGELIETVDKWPHLGNVISVNQDDATAISVRRVKFIGQANDVLGFFGNLDAIVKTDLLFKYCSSFYGSVLWDLRSPELSHVCSAWRSALRRVWHLPLKTHSAIVTAISSRRPMFDELCRRTVSFIFSCMFSCNSIVRQVTQYALLSGRALSPVGRNILFLCDRYGLKTDDFLTQTGLGSGLAAVDRFCLSQINNAVSEVHLNLLLELLMLRDKVFSLSSSIERLDRSDIDYMICELCSRT
jgi:Reverse transcriptase (RNA-dependent DNA polymerase)